MKKKIKATRAQREAFRNHGVAFYYNQPLDATTVDMIEINIYGKKLKFKGLEDKQCGEGSGKKLNGLVYFNRKSELIGLGCK